MILRHAFIPSDNARLANLAGSFDEHLKTIAAAFEVKIQRRNESFRVEGAKGHAERAVVLLQHLYGRAARPIGAEEVELAILESMSDDGGRGEVAGSRGARSSEPADPAEAVADAGPDLRLRTRRPDLVGRTPNQIAYLKNILAHDISFGIGPAGTGKTYLAVACAVDALERNAVQRVILTRPAVEAGERLGFLPGDLAQKVDPYLRPLYDALYELMGLERVGKAFEKGTLEVAPLAFMRGRTLNHAFVILDEAQNTTTEQMKMFLTRIGFGAKAVVTGDTSQIDLPKGTVSGLVDAERVLRDVKGIATTRFTSADVVRHPLVARIVEAYDAAGSERADPAATPRRRATRPPLRLSLQFADPRHRAVLSRVDVARWIRAALTVPAEITVRIVDADEGLALNREYRGQDHATNVLTFPYATEPLLSADLVLCAPVVEAEAASMGIALVDHYAHLLVHGTLHAQGFDHELEVDATRMEARETEILAGLGVADPYAR